MREYADGRNYHHLCFYVFIDVFKLCVGACICYFQDLSMVNP